MAMLYDINSLRLVHRALPTTYSTLQTVLRTAMVFHRDYLASHWPKPFPKTSDGQVLLKCSKVYPSKKYGYHIESFG